MTTMPMWKKSIAAGVIAGTAIVGVCGVAAAAPTPVAATHTDGATTITLPQELRQEQGTVPGQGNAQQHGADQPAQIAGHKSVKLRVINHTGVWVKVTDHGADDNVMYLEPWDHYDVSGWSFWAGHPDVTADIQAGNGAKVPVWGYNPEVGYPSVGVGNTWDRYSVGESHVKKLDDTFSVTVTRQEDEDMKLFTMEVTGNQNR